MKYYYNLTLEDKIVIFLEYIHEMKKNPSIFMTMLDNNKLKVQYSEKISVIVSYFKGFLQYTHKLINDVNKNTCKVEIEKKNYYFC